MLPVQRDPSKEGRYAVPLSAPVFQILVALADQDRHGYAIMREVEILTNGSTRMGPGTLYGTIKRLLASGLVEEAEERPDPELDDERRRYYRITKLGTQVLEAETARLATLLGAARAKKIVPKARRA
jgi:DNA-binding PadR family transcriptional regulator